MHSNADGRAMGLKDALRAAVERSTGLRVMRQPPFGLDKYADIKLVLAGHPMRTLIDIGANVGQTARELRKAWPDAEIHCCEPVPTTFNALKAAVAGDARTHCHPVAIGARHETLEMHLAQGGERSDISSLHAGHPALDGARITHIPVQVIPLTELFEQQGITHADLLKIDTEGFDWNVLAGFDTMLGPQLRAIQFEYNEWNVVSRRLLADFHELLEPKGYRIGKVHPNGVAFTPYSVADENWIGPACVAVHESAPDMISAIAVR